MNLKGIISISGMNGLYKVMAQARNGFIAEAIADKKRLPVSANLKVSALEDISIFGISNDIPLKEVLVKMKETANTIPLPDPKADPSVLKAYFKSVLPEFDAARVYPSDIKKVITWYLLLKDIVDTEETPEENTEASNSEKTIEVAEVLAKKHTPPAPVNKPLKTMDGKKERTSEKKASATKTRKKV